MDVIQLDSSSSRMRIRWRRHVTIRYGNGMVSQVDQNNPIYQTAIIADAALVESD